MLAAILFVAASGCTWRQTPEMFGPSWSTVYRRLTEWSQARVWAKLPRLVLDELGANGDLDAHVWGPDLPVEQEGQTFDAESPAALELLRRFRSCLPD